MRLSDDVSSVRQARLFASAWARDHSLPRQKSDDLALIVSELVTNAVRHGAPPFDLELRRDGSVVSGEICDCSPELPTTVDDPDECGGYGLLIVSAQARWGVERSNTGKRVWFEIE
jgi:two-component sensor histidine kinase